MRRAISLARRRSEKFQSTEANTPGSIKHGYRMILGLIKKPGDPRRLFFFFFFSFYFILIAMQLAARLAHRGRRAGVGFAAKPDPASLLYYL